MADRWVWREVRARTTFHCLYHADSRDPRVTIARAGVGTWNVMMADHRLRDQGGFLTIEEAKEYAMVAMVEAALVR